jgi:hypothetical protein
MRVLKLTVYSEKSNISSARIVWLKSDKKKLNGEVAIKSVIKTAVGDAIKYAGSGL